VLEQLGAGMSVSEIARQAGIARSTVRAIKDGVHRQQYS